MAEIKKGSRVRIKRKESYWYNEIGVVASREKEPTQSRYPITVRFDKGNYYGLQGIDGGNNTNNFAETELELIEGWLVGIIRTFYGWFNQPFGICLQRSNDEKNDRNHACNQYCTRTDIAHLQIPITKSD